MATRTLRQHAEVFHLLFLRLLTTASDRANYRVKGGCNLRFWLRSVRYSEDIDLDVVITAKQTLKNKVDRILSGAPLETLLRAQQLTIVDFSSPKQTETTQRWKVTISVAGSATPIHTKIEFSRRGTEGSHSYEPVDGALARQYQLVAPMAHHYLAAAAASQKISALAHRAETQARDLFDLGLLFAALGNEQPELDDHQRKDLSLAIEHAMSIGYDDYAGQVVAYLEPTHGGVYKARAAFDQLQAAVIGRLEELL